MAACAAAVWLWAAPAAGIEISEIAPGVYRGSAPESQADYATLERMGIRTVLDLRKYNRDEVACERRILAGMGIAHIHLPMGFFPRRDHSVERALAILRDPALSPIYLHCKLGQDRVGLVVGMYRVRYQGVSPAAAYGEMERFGYHRFLVGLTRYFREQTGEPQRRLAGHRGAAGRETSGARSKRGARRSRNTTRVACRRDRGGW